jgi:DDE_Tnp_1-associated/Transposase DDE domain
MLDLHCATIHGAGGLLERLAAITDPRAKRGVRHRLVSLLAIAAAAALSGAKSFVAVGKFAAELSQEALARLGARRHPVTGRYVAPHEATLRRAIRSVDPDQLDRVLGGWLAEQTHPAPGHSSDQQLPVVAVDGKTLRGARGTDGRQLQLVAAMLHGHGTVLAQREVDHTTNEITQFRPLLDDLDLRGMVVTADALHTQADHARYLIQDKHADYLFTVKANQPGLQATIDRLPPDAFSPSAHPDRPWPWPHRAPNDPGERRTPGGHLPARRPAARHRPVCAQPGRQLSLGGGRLRRD